MRDSHVFFVLFCDHDTTERKPRQAETSSNDDSHMKVRSESRDVFLKESSLKSRSESREDEKKTTEDQNLPSPTKERIKVMLMKPMDSREITSCLTIA